MCFVWCVVWWQANDRHMCESNRRERENAKEKTVSVAIGYIHAYDVLAVYSIGYFGFFKMLITGAIGVAKSYRKID